MLVVLEASKLVKSIDFKELLSENIYFIDLTFDIFKLEKLIDSNDFHPENI